MATVARTGDSRGQVAAADGRGGGLTARRPAEVAFTWLLALPGRVPIATGYAPKGAPPSRCYSGSARTRQRPVTAHCALRRPFAPDGSLSLAPWRWRPPRPPGVAGRPRVSWKSAAHPGLEIRPGVRVVHPRSAPTRGRGSAEIRAWGLVSSAPVWAGRGAGDTRARTPGSRSCDVRMTLLTLTN